MKRLAAPAFLAAFVLAFALAGCSGAQTITEDTLKGTWKLDSSTDLGFEAYMDFENSDDDHLATVIVADSWLDGTWKVSDKQASIEFEDYYMEEEESSSSSSSSSSSNTKTAKLTYSNNKLTLGSPDGSKLVFVKDDSEKTKNMFDMSYDNEDLDGLEDEEVETVDEVINPVDPAVSVANDDKFVISVTGKGTDYTGDPCYRMSITNKTGKAVYITADDEFTVGGKKIDAGVGDEIEAGQTIETDMYFAKDELGGALEALTTTDGTLQIYDSESDELVASYTFHMD